MKRIELLEKLLSRIADVIANSEDENQIRNCLYEQIDLLLPLYKDEEAIIYTAADKNNNVHLYEGMNKTYVILCTRRELMPKGIYQGVPTNMKLLIDFVDDHPKVDGMVINPESDSFTILDKWLIDILVAKIDKKELMS